MPPRLEVITGPMFSGKSEILISRAKRATLAKKIVLAIKPSIDTRTDGIASRKLCEDGSTETTDRLSSQEVGTEEELLSLLTARPFDVLIVDEAQFFPLDKKNDQLGWFGRTIARLLHERKKDDLRIYIAGLDMTWEGLPFNGMPGLCAIADHVEKVTAICECTNDAQHSQRLTADTSQVMVGDAETYLPRCRLCFEPGP